MSSDEEERKLKKTIFKNPVEVQKARLERLMKNVEKPVFIPEKKDSKLPRAFAPHEFVRNVMGASAGAGSGEFDIYRGCRRRQIIREAFLNRQAKEKEASEEWLAKVENNKKKAETQTAKKRKKRMKRKGNTKTKKPTNGQNSNDKDGKSSSSSSGSDDEEVDEKTSDTETKTSETPITKAEENQSVKEPSSPVQQQQQQNEKTNIRQHLRHRKASSSDEEKA
ncbi:unnamed protein product [Adineta steineri]|uniref:Uncharacterized protein n=1 Tax=Adineta steineri TaxID=433720 RepID=A0A814DQ55_9BILA|nr:unnamed protein product [Adineta steineri]CAF3739946.1 unnamed protein product [Adineta steineri]